MFDLSLIGRLLFILGLVIAGFGLVLIVFGRLPGIGQLPGDIVIRRENWSLYFPITTAIIISVILTIILNLVLRR